MEHQEWENGRPLPLVPGGGDPSVLDANYPPQLTVGRRPLGGGGSWRPRTRRVAPPPPGPPSEGAKMLRVCRCRGVHLGAPEGTLGYCTGAQEAVSTKRRKKFGASVAYKTIGTFLSQE